MAEFVIRIAGTSFAVTSLFESTRDYCKHYLTAESPDFFVKVFPDDLVFEQDFLDQEAKEEGLKRRKFSDPFLERAAIQRKVADILFEQDVLLFHGSGLSLDGDGYLFTAKCGTGKSTHARHWREQLGAVAVNDDKPFLKISADGVTMYGAPWSGKHGLDTNMAVPLKGICILERGPENRIRKISPEEAMAELLHQGCPPLADSAQSRFRELTKLLAGAVPLWRMECAKDPQSAAIAHTAMANP